jgi:hypothetical protein
MTKSAATWRIEAEFARIKVKISCYNVPPDPNAAITLILYMSE